MKKPFLVVLFAIPVLMPVMSQAAVLQIVGGSVVGATGVEVNGDLYDVEFADGTLASVFGFTDPASYDFQSSGDALAAAQALIDQVLIGSVDDDPELIQGVTDEVQSFTHIPYSHSAPGDLAHPFSFNARARNHEQEFLDSTLAQIILQDSFDSSIPFSASNPFNGERNNWARFTLVPEPSSLAMLGFGGIALRRRRR